jgi:uncharacterized protein
MPANLLPALVLCVLAATAPRPPPPDDEATVVRDAATWDAERKTRLSSEDGWFTLVGLFWLPEGDVFAGSAPEAKVRLPASAPARVGTFHRKGAEVSFTPAPGTSLTVGDKPFTGGALRSDEQGKPDVLRTGTLRLTVIVRQGRVGVRVKDSEAPARKAFAGIERFAPSSRWRVEARLLPQPVKLPVPTVLGTTETMESPGTLVFMLEGKERRLRPVVEEGSDELFLIFADLTNKKDTYGAGRFLDAPMPVDGKTVLDFNRAYNPPCAFSAFATCPVPPAGNRLDVRVEAGEKRYAH